MNTAETIVNEIETQTEDSLFCSAILQTENQYFICSVEKIHSHGLVLNYKSESPFSTIENFAQTTSVELKIGNKTTPLLNTNIRSFTRNDQQYTIEVSFDQVRPEFDELSATFPAYIRFENDLKLNDLILAQL